MTMVRFYHPEVATPRVNGSIWNSLFNQLLDMDSRLDSAGTFVPRANSYENENEYVLELLVPGLSKEDLKIDLNEEVLNISSEVKNESKAQFRLREFHYGTFKRSFTLPEDVDSDKISASYENGILRVSLPKVEAAPKIQRQIEIK